MKIPGRVEDSSRQLPSKWRRILAKLLPVLMYTIIFPSLLFIIPKLYLDSWLKLSIYLPPFISGLLAGGLITLGIVFVIWSIRAQLELGKGTPMPLMATQKLVVDKAYFYCRNPIFFGVISLFFGISILFNSLSSLFAVLLFSVIILIYTKFIEEKELENRFGAEYLVYKEKTPFIIPLPSSLWRKK